MIPPALNESRRMIPLSEQWGRSVHRGLAAASDPITRCALAIGSIRSLIRVVDDSQPPMTCDWARVGKDDKGKLLSVSYTDFAGSRIAVNPLPVFEGKLSPGDALDVCSGFGLHEASHAKESRDRYKDLLIHDDAANDGYGKERPAFRPMRLAAYLWNLVEDVRIETATSAKWPGFAPYFERVLDYMWTHIEQGMESAGPWDEAKPLTQRLRTVFLACRYPAKAMTKLDPSEAGEVEWWQAWQADYLAGRADTKQTIQRGLDHLAEDEQTQRQMDEQAAEELAEEKAGEKARAQLDRLMREGIEGVPGFCISDDGDIRPLTEHEAGAIDQLVKEGLVELRPLFTDDDNKCAAVRVSRPLETEKSRRAYIGRPTPLVEALRASLVFRSERPRYDLKLQKDGVLDDEELWRLATNDRRVFSERIIEGRPDTLLALLVDLSGSMAGSKLRTAQYLAQTFLWATHDQEGVETRVYGHSGDGHRGSGADIYRLWEQGEPLSRLGLISTLDHANNFDGFAIGCCVNEMRQEPQPSKALIVLSDGEPAGHGYGGRTAERHMRTVGDWAEREGVTVIQIAISDDLQPDRQAAMFRHWLPYHGDATLPRDLARLLGRLTQ